MNINLADVDDLSSAEHDVAVGPLVAPEAEHLVEALTAMAVGDVASDAWLTQHGWLERLNMQAHANAAQMRDEFVMEALVLHDKLAFIVHDLVASELWRARVLPLVKAQANRQDGVRLYQVIYHEAVVCNLLEVCLFHRQACEAVGDALVDLCDYVQRQLVWVQTEAAPPRHLSARDAAEARAALLADAGAGGSDPETAAAAQLDAQLAAVQMGAAVSCCSVLRFLLDHSDHLPAGVLARLVDTHDVLMVACSLLEKRPWRARRQLDGTEVRFEGGQWVPVPDAQRHRLPKVEAQLWLAVLALATDPAVRRRYAFTDFRKAALVRLRKYLNETVVDQIPPLVALQRAIDELSMQETPAVDPKPAYLLEQLPQIREALEKGQDWDALAQSALATAFASGPEAKRARAEELAALYASKPVEALLAGPGMAGSAHAGAGEAGGWDAPGEYALRVQAWPAGAEASAPASAVTQAVGRAPSVQTSFQVQSDRAALPPPGGRARAALLAPSGAELAAVEAPLVYAGNKGKQWCQVGHEPTGLRVQLLLVRAASGEGVAIGAARVTAPERHAVRLEFVPETADAAHTAVVVAEGAAGPAQALFRPTGGTGSTPVPASCRVRAELRAGERLWRAQETRLELSPHKALQWAQVGKGSASLRLQLRLRQAVHSGAQVLELASVYVTLPDEHAATQADASPATHAATGPAGGSGHGGGGTAGESAPEPDVSPSGAAGADARTEAKAARGPKIEIIG